MTRGGEANDRAAAWIVAKEGGVWNEQRQAELDAWLAEADGNKAAYWRLKHGWREVDRISALGRGNEPDSYEPRRWRWRAPLAIAASLAIVAVAGQWMLAQRADSRAAVTTATFDTPVGGKQLTGLPDGSRIQLNTDSVVRTAFGGHAREVWLDKGEAFFEVAHLEGRPFVVHAGNRRITVLGTKFAVRRDHGRVIVSVLEGRVRIDQVDGSRELRSATITRGDVAIGQGDATLVTSRSETRVESNLAWRTGMLDFDRTSLGDAAAEFNRYNAKQIVIADPAVAGIRIGGSFPANKPRSFAALLHNAYGLRVEENAEAIKISD
jgi:transmembrane sensor